MMPATAFISRRIFAGLMLASAALFIALPLWNLAAYPPSAFAVGVPQSWQGAIEAVVLISLLIATQGIPRPGFRLAAILFLSEVYLRRHGVDISIAIDLLYLEVLLGVGAAIMRYTRSRVPADSADYLRCFVLGLAGWSICAWTMSAFGCSSLNALRVLTLILALAAAAAARPRLLTAFVHARVRAMPLPPRIAFAVLFGWLLVLCAKTGVVVGFDPLWYGLRGEYVLVGDGSAYTPLGLVSAVYYFPKLYEMLLLPVSGLGNSSVISGMSVMVLILLLLSCEALLKQLGVTRRAMRIAIVASCATLPVIANPALDAKPDLLAALLLTIAWLHANEFVMTRRSSAAAWMVSCLLLATQAKLTAIPFAASLMLGTMVALLRRDRTGAIGAMQGELRAAKVGLVMAIVVALFVTARTFLLTGMPTIGPDALFHLWTTLGFTLVPPTGTLNWTNSANWGDTAALARDLLFRPELLDHILITWTGNLWLWCALLVLVARWTWPPAEPASGPRAPALTGAALMLTGLILMFCVSYGIRGGDGNYFIAAVISATLVGAAAMSRSIQSASATRAAIGCLAAFSLFQASYSFLSSSWTAGTREFDANFTRGLHSFRRENRRLLENNGLGVIERHLRRMHHTARVVGCLDDNLDLRLPARSESAQQISYSRWEYVADAAHFLDYLAANRIEFLIMPNADIHSVKCSALPGTQPAAQQLAADISVTTIHDSEYVMYDLSRWHRAVKPSVDNLP